MGGEAVLALRDIDEYLLPTERRVIRVRQHFAVMLKDILVTALFLLLMVVAQRHLLAGVLVDNLTSYLSLVAAGEVPAHTDNPPLRREQDSADPAVVDLRRDHLDLDRARDDLADRRRWLRTPRVGPGRRT